MLGQSRPSQVKSNLQVRVLAVQAYATTQVQVAQEQEEAGRRRPVCS